MYFPTKILHTFGVFLRVILVGHGVCGTGAATILWVPIFAS